MVSSVVVSAWHTFVMQQLRNKEQLAAAKRACGLPKARKQVGRQRTRH